MMNDELLTRIVHRVVATWLCALKDGEREVIKRRLGIGVGINQTLAEIGKAMKLTKERVRQKETNGMRKLRIPIEELLPNRRDQEFANRLNELERDVKRLAVAITTGDSKPI